MCEINVLLALAGLGLADMGLIRRLILFFGVLAMVWAPTIVCAQYSGAFGLSGLPSMPSFFGASGKCGEAASFPGIGAPAVYCGWGIAQDGNTSVSLTSQHYGFSVSQLNVQGVDVKLPTGGFWLGRSFPICLTKNVSFVATSWYLFPVSASATLQESVAFNGFIRNSWRTRYNWWFVDGAFAYTFGGSCRDCRCFSLLLGLRYDYYTASLSDPTGDLGIGHRRLFEVYDEGDVILCCWIPFVGLQTAYTDSVQNLKVIVWGIPTNRGSSNIGLTFSGNQRFEYDNVPNSGGGFLEIFGEYTRKFFGASQAGVFARWNLATANSSGTGGFVGLTAAFDRDTFDFQLNRSTWTLGGLVTLDFNTLF